MKQLYRCKRISVTESYVLDLVANILYVALFVSLQAI